MANLRSVIELIVDATKAKSGGAEAEKVLDEVRRIAEEAQKSIKGVGDASQKTGQTMQKSLATTGSFVTISGGLTQIGYNFDALTAGTGRFDTALVTAGRSMLDFQRIGADLAFEQDRINRATGETVTKWGALKGLIAANPWLALAAGISAVGTAISFFTSKTDEATQAQKRFTDQVKQLQQTQAVLGVRAKFGDPTLTVPERISGNIDALQNFLANSRNIDVNELATALGTTPNLSDSDYASFESKGGVITSGIVKAGPARRLAAEQLQTLYYLRQQFANAQQDRPSSGLAGGASGGVGASRVTDFDAGYYRQEIAQSQILQQRNLDELEERMKELNDLGRGVGYSIADGLDRAIEKGGDLRDILRGIIADIGRTLYGQAAQGFANALGKGFAATASQSSADSRFLVSSGTEYGTPNNNAS